MARAKTTHRAEARRRYRAQLAAEEAAASSEELAPNVLSSGHPQANVVTSGRPTQARGETTTSSTASPARRPSVIGAIRIAAAPADIPGDIRALPQIAVRTKAVWVPALLIVGTGTAFLIPALAENAIVRFLGVALLAPPPMIPAFLAGMLTARASWLVGGVAGLLSGLTVAFLLTAAPATTSSTKGLDIQNIGYLLLVGPLFGMGVGAFSGFYRRFLALSSPARQQPRKSNQGSRSSKRR